MFKSNRFHVFDLNDSAPIDLMHFCSFYDSITFHIKMRTASRTILLCALKFCLVYEHILSKKETLHFLHTQVNTVMFL